MRLTWLTDLHLDPHWYDDGQRLEYVRALARMKTDAFVISGDISNGATLMSVLDLFDAHLSVPVYYVLGNHDYWSRGTVSIRTQLRQRSGRSLWLGSTNYVSLTPTTALIGRDGWYDGRAGYYFASDWITHDWKLIADFVPPLNNSWGTSEGSFLTVQRHECDREHIYKVMQRLADADTVEIVHALEAAFEKHQEVILTTHVPPFGVASRFRGQPSPPETLPFYCNHNLGERLLDVMEHYEDRRLIVLCGHTHGQYDLRVCANLHVRVGGAEYGIRESQGTFEVK